MTFKGMMMILLGVLIGVTANLMLRAGVDRAGGFPGSLQQMPRALFNLVMEPFFDGGMILYAAAAYYWALRLSPRSPAVFAVITGLCAGFSMTTKFSNIPVVIPGIALLVLFEYAVVFNNRIMSLKELAQRALLTAGIICLKPLKYS